MSRCHTGLGPDTGLGVCYTAPHTKHGLAIGARPGHWLSAWQVRDILVDHLSNHMVSYWRLVEAPKKGGLGTHMAPIGFL